MTICHADEQSIRYILFPVHTHKHKHKHKQPYWVQIIVLRYVLYIQKQRWLQQNNRTGTTVLLCLLLKIATHYTDAFARHLSHSSFYTTMPHILYSTVYSAMYSMALSLSTFHFLHFPSITVMLFVKCSLPTTWLSRLPLFSVLVSVLEFIYTYFYFNVQIILLFWSVGHSVSNLFFPASFRRQNNNAWLFCIREFCLSNVNCTVHYFCLSCTVSTEWLVQKMA